MYFYLFSPTQQSVFDPYKEVYKTRLRTRSQHVLNTICSVIMELVIVSLKNQKSQCRSRFTDLHAVL